MRYQSLIKAACNTVWAIMPDKLEAICAVLTMKVDNEFRSEAEIDAIVAQRRNDKARNAGTIGILPLMGTIAHRMGSLEASSGGTSSEAFAADFDRMVDDSAIDAILLDIDSPGGTVHGVTELAERIFEARGTKPIFGLANSMAASAAYWIGSAVDKLYVTPSGMVGSIGVVAVHTDMSASDEQLGFKFTVLTAGEHKAEAHPHAPLSEDAKDNILRDLDAFHTMFIDDVARNRGTSKLAVKRDFGKGRTVLAADAMAAGMVDGIATFEEVIGKLSKKIKTKAALNAWANRTKLALVQ